MRKFISFFEIFIIVLAVVSFAYIFSENKIDFKDNFLTGFVEKVAKPVLPVVSAQSSSTDDLFFKCCERTKIGASCQDVIDTDECNKTFMVWDDKCEKTEECRLGCCIDELEGTYDESVPESLCKGKFLDSPECYVSGSEYGCCNLGSKTVFITRQQCEMLFKREGNSSAFDWRLIDEVYCNVLPQLADEGACFFEGEEERCEFSTKDVCGSSGGEFYKGVLCTAFEDVCEKTEKTVCIEGKDEVYYVDSCGNRANIYDSSRYNDEEYWTHVSPKNQSCGASSANGNSGSRTCGNCDRFSGGICSSALKDSVNPMTGDNYCRETSCEYKGKTYKNGESWCEYDGKIGFNALTGASEDVVGSRHWKYVCNFGSVQIEYCQDYRNEICVQSDSIEVNEEDVDFLNAACRPNNAKTCLSLNGDEIAAMKCLFTPDCAVKHIDMGGSFKFDVCVPQYPPGFSLEENEAENGVCAMASQTCTISYEQKTFSGCKCVDNCDCETSKFTEDMNDLCRSLGDCGMSANIAGKVTSNFRTKEAKPVGPTYYLKLISAATPVPGQYAGVGNLDAYLKKAGLLGGDSGSSEDFFDEILGGELLGGDASGAIGRAFRSSPGAPRAGNADGSVGGTMGTVGGGVAAVGGISMAAGGIMAHAGVTGILSATTLAQAQSAMALQAAAPSFQAFGGAVMGIGIGMAVGGFLASLTGASPGFAMVATISGGVAGFIVADMLMKGLTLCAGASVGCVVVLGVVLVVMIASLFGGSKCKPVEVEFECLPWQAPYGGADCGKCNEDPMKPCTAYRCKSLGKACTILNEGTGEELCVSEKDDGKPIKISPNNNFISDFARYSNVGEGGFKIADKEEDCFNAYENLMFGINTSKPTECKYDLENKAFDEMTSQFGAGTGMLMNHTISFRIPNPVQAESQGSTWDGNIVLYTKCKDMFGREAYYTIRMCVNKAPDIKPAFIEMVEPESNKVLGFETILQEVSVYVDEPSECRWSSADKTYDEMENNFECANAFEDMGIDGFLCKAELPLTGAENKFYFRCKDQPWISEGEETDETHRNANVESYAYVLKKAESALEILNIQPAENAELLNAQIFTLTATTSGGVGNAVCSYSTRGYSGMIEFLKTNSTYHEQPGMVLDEGNYKIRIECKDEAGISARAERNIIVKKLEADE